MRLVLRLLGAEVLGFELTHDDDEPERPTLEAGSGGLFDPDGLDFPRPDEVKLGFRRR